MAFTLTTATTEVRALLNESSASFWSDTEIENWIKQGCLDWTEKSLLLSKEDTITTSTSTYKYTTSGNSYIDDAILTMHAEYSNKALRRINYEQLRGHTQLALASDAAPQYYWDQYDGTTFTFYIAPTPSSTYNNKTITVTFACRTDDITEIPYEYQQAIFLYAYSKAKTKERQFQEAALAWQQYVNGINFARRDSLEKSPMPIDSFRTQ